MMPQPSFSGGVIISGTRIIVPIDIATVEPGIVIPVQVTSGSISIGTVQAVIDIATIGTILSPVDIASVLSPITVNAITGAVTIASVQSPLDVATVLSPITVNSITDPITVASVQSPLDVATVLSPITVNSITDPITVASVQSPVDIASVLSSISIGSVLVPIDIASVLSPITYGQDSSNVNVQTNATLTSSGAATISMQKYQDLVVDIVYGSIQIGSVQTNVVGIEPQSGQATGTVVSGGLYGTQPYANTDRLQAVGPLGYQVIVQWEVYGTVSGVYITAERSTTG